ncbi:MAG: peptidase M15 [Rhodospirillaceae bacterium]|nr:MAG: peptidase M15 [Rhodospirillaceae bacterium]
MNFFKISEFDSPDEKGSGKKMQQSTLEMLDKARGIAGISFVITSGYRTKEHNKKVGGVDSSAHTSGYAADIRVKDGRQRYLITRACMNAGFNRIGIAGTFIHIDNDPTKAENVIWKY